MVLKIFCVLLSISKILAFTTPTNRIVGGNLSNLGQFPFAVALLRAGDQKPYGGSILNNEWILTSAQCVDTSLNISVYYGIINYQDVSVPSILANAPYTKHPQFDTLTLENNIGLIKLPQKLVFNDNIQPISSLGLQKLSNYATVTVVGWGHKSDSDTSFSGQLHHVSLHVIANDQCLSTYNDQLKDSMACVLGFTTEGICNVPLGDTGGPAVQIGTNGSVIQVGIASLFVENKCETLEPTVLQRTFEYADWIQGVSGPLGDDGTNDGGGGGDDNNNGNGTADKKLVIYNLATLLVALSLLLS